MFGDIFTDIAIKTNSERVATFIKVSKEMYDRIHDEYKDMAPSFAEYDNIIIPKRATECSAGYDFYTPMHIHLYPKDSIVIPTCIKVYMESDWALHIMPKSGFGFKYGLKLANTIGLIDADYINTKNDSLTNEGHIMIKLVNDGDREVDIPQGKAFVQGVFLRYGTASNDNFSEMSTRNGGIGSTL